MKTITKTLSHLIHRWKAPTPKFWKKVQRICFGLGTVGTLITGGASLYGFIPQWIVETCLSANLVGVFIQFVKEGDKNESDIRKSDQGSNTP